MNGYFLIFLQIMTSVHVKQEPQLKEQQQQHQDDSPAEDEADESNSNRTRGQETEDASGKLGFSIAQIMGFMGAKNDLKSNPPSSPSIPSTKSVDNGSSSPPKLWRPQPCREFISAAAAAMASGASSLPLAPGISGFTGNLTENPLTALNNPNSQLGAMALLRQYSLLGLPPSWKASLYNSILMHQAASAASTVPTVKPFNSVNGYEAPVRPLGIPPPPPFATGSLLPPPPQLTAHFPANGSYGTSSGSKPSMKPPIAVGEKQSSRSRTGSATSSESTTPSSANNNKQRTYPCGECGKIFNAHYNLTRHMPVHTGK